MQARPDTLWSRAPALVTIAVTYAVLMAVSLPMIADPFVRHDDFPALLAMPESYFVKTLDEGRWLNYLWHLRGFVIPSWLAFALYQLLWAIFAGAAALVICGPAARPLLTVCIALLVMVAPPAAMISLWFNTLVPGLALVALFAVLTLRCGAYRMRPWLLLFVPLTLACYTSYPLLLLALLLVAHDTRWSLRDLAGLVALFVAGFALGLLAIYSLNHAVHGVFGIPMAEWRQPNPAQDLASLLENLAMVGDFLLRTLDGFSHEFAPVAFVLLAVLFFGLVLVARHEGWPAAYIATGFLVGFGLVTLQILRTGILLSPRVLIFAWLLFAALIARMARIAEGTNPFGARMLRNAVLIVIGSYALNTAKTYATFMPWQAETRAIAQALAGGEGPIWITGSYESVPHADLAGIQNPRGLALRLRYLTGRMVHDCSEGADRDPACADPSLAPPPPAAPLRTARIEQSASGTLLRLPDAPPEAADRVALN